jgi:outer membrane protein assembly factor BamB
LQSKLNLKRNAEILAPDHGKRTIAPPPFGGDNAAIRTVYRSAGLQPPLVSIQLANARNAIRFEDMDFRDPAARVRQFRVSTCAILTAVFGLFDRASLNAQIPIVVPLTAPSISAPVDAESGAAQQGSTILKADRKTLELLEDFDRYAGKKAWQLAFKVLYSLDESSKRRLAPAGDGLLLPTSDWVRQRLNSLPPEGREAYRLFNDANAKRLWDHTQAGWLVDVSESSRPHVSRESSSNPLPDRDAERFMLPATDEPLWQIRIAGPYRPGQLNPRNGTSMSSTIHAVAAAAVVGNRLYANWLGTVYAADLETGKLLWRTGDFIKAPKEAINYAQGEPWTDCFALVPSGGKLFVMRPPVTNQLGETLAPDAARDVALAIECLDVVSGKTLWRAPKLNVSVLAGPYLVDGIEYLVASGGRDELILIGIDMQTGRVRTRILFGGPQNPNTAGGYQFGGPKMLASGGTLYVATNNRSLFAFDLASHEIEWALELDSGPESNSQLRSLIDGMRTASFVGQSALEENDGVVYFKDGSMPMVFALDPAERSVKWKRPISREDSIAAIDGPIAYLVGNGLSALDLKSRKLLWSTKIPDQMATLRPLIFADHIYTATSRGVFDIDPANGNVRRIFRGADREASEGKLLVAGDKLICVSDTAVTAYPIQRVKPRNGTAQNH